jgi:hypothetical protein
MRKQIERWRIDHNADRPGSGRPGVSPTQFFSQ